LKPPKNKHFSLTFSESDRREVTRRLIKRSSFSSINELKQKILDFIEYFNATMAKKINWKYCGDNIEVNTGNFF